MKRILVVLLLMVLAFLLGYIPMYFRCRGIQESLGQAQSRMTDVQEKLRLASLQADLGMVLVQVDQNNFGSAKDLSSSFFDSVRAAVSGMPEGALASSLNAVLAQRDAITSDLSTLNPESGRKLRELFLQLRQAAGG